MASKVEITTDAGFGKILLDGTDISNAVRCVRMIHHAGRLPELELEVVAVPLDYRGEARTSVHLPPEARQLLIDHGWTPPEEGHDG